MYAFLPSDVTTISHHYYTEWFGLGSFELGQVKLRSHCSEQFYTDLPRVIAIQALSGGRRGAYCTRNVDPKALPQASSAFRSVVCEDIPNIAPHIAANIKIGTVCI